ncbi:MAG: ATP-binding protein [Eubacterium sp.]|nr:ATP-binding protein [Eubacterium sp.]
MTSFATGTNSIYYCAASASDVKQQELFGKVVMERYSLLHEPADYADAFSMIELRESADLLIAIDKAENILKKDSVFLESLCAFISKCKIKVHVFFATEDVPFVTGDFLKLVAGHKDLYLGECRIEELTFLEMVRLFSNKPTREIIQMYGITGGVPDYLPCWNPKLSLKDNIIRSVLSPRGYLFNEAEEFLHTQLRETSVYETILSTLASGVNKLNDIYKATGFSRAKISVYMKNLAAFGVASKQDSFETGGWENAKKGMYVINDTFLHFWFTFVYPHQSELHILPPATFYERYIEPDLDYYMDEYFVKVCREYLELLEQAESLPIVTAKEGTWIGKNGRIDIILQNDIRENVVGYCSWSDRHMSLAHLEHLNNSMEQARVKAVKRYMFSSGVFDDDLKAVAADDPTLELVDMNEL